MMYDGDGHGGWAVWMLLMMLLFWGSLAALVWVGFRSFAHHPSVPSGRKEAREVLAMRLARGEIEPEEYERRLAVLDGQP